MNRRLQDDPGADASPVFSGKQPNGSPLEDGHRHAHFLPEANDRHGRITHVTVYGREGFAAADRRALESLAEPHRRIWQKSGYPVRLVLLGFGEPQGFAGDGHRPDCPILARGRVWVSRTPLVLTRYPRLRPSEIRDPLARAAAMRRELVQAVRLELARRPQFEDVADRVLIEPLFGRNECGTWFGSRFTSWLKFYRDRPDGHGAQAGNRGFGFRLEFPEKVQGPVALGYGCHFGLGQFWPEQADSERA